MTKIEELAKQISELEERLALLSYEHQTLLQEHLRLIALIRNTSVEEEAKRFRQLLKENTSLFVQTDLDNKTISSEFLDDEK